MAESPAIFSSPAFDAIVADEHKPSPENGGPCATCAFREGTEANRTEHTVWLAKSCVEGGHYFCCHEKDQLCRGFVAAVNLRGGPFDETAGLLADVLADAIAIGVEADRKVGRHG